MHQFDAADINAGGGGGATQIFLRRRMKLERKFDAQTATEWLGARQ